MWDFSKARRKSGGNQYCHFTKSQLCMTGWQQVKIRGTGITPSCRSLNCFGLYVKQISSALTGPTETWLEPASPALPWLTPTRQISTGGGWICAPTPRTACKNDTLPFTNLKCTKSVLSSAQVTSEITCAGFVFFPFTPSHDCMASTRSTCFPFSMKLAGMVRK